MTRQPSLAERLRALRSEEGSVAAYLDELAVAFDRREEEVRAFVPEPGRFERLRQEAAELEARYPAAAERPPLYGLPVAVKDIFHVDGFPTRAGSRVPGLRAEDYLRQSIVEPSAFVVDGFEDGKMPADWEEMLTPEEVEALVAYLLTLQ